MNELQNNDFYLLRWRFDFTSGSSRFGMWSQPGDIVNAGAWRQTKAGLYVARALVEGKHITSRITSVLAECPGQDYVNFEWLALAHVAPFGIRGKVVPFTRLGGLSIVTREDIIQVTIDGKVTRNMRPDSHKRIGFATFGQ